MNSGEEDRSRSIRRDRHVEKDGSWLVTSEPDRVATEEPLEIRVEGKPIAVVMRTPGNDEELTAGFLLTEGVVSRAGEIFELSQCPSVINSRSGTEGSTEEETSKSDKSDWETSLALKGNAMDAILTDSKAASVLESLTRHVFSSSSCGICGKATIDSIVTSFPEIKTRPPVESAILASLPEKLRARQSTFELTGGLHACGIFDAPNGELEVLREDVGRHNAVDKSLGRLLLDGNLPATNRILLVSGRISFEIMQKALAAGIPVVAGISAPTSLAVDFACATGQQLVAFLRDGKFNSYT